MTGTTDDDDRTDRRGGAVDGTTLALRTAMQHVEKAIVAADAAGAKSVSYWLNSALVEIRDILAADGVGK